MKRANVRRTGAGGDPGLHICPECHSNLVQPVRREGTARSGYQRLWRLCPDCGWRCESMHTESELKAFDRALKDGTRELERALTKRQYEGIQDIQEAFSAALEADLITADDFR